MCRGAIYKPVRQTQNPFVKHKTRSSNTKPVRQTQNIPNVPNIHWKRSGKFFWSATAEQELAHKKREHQRDTNKEQREKRTIPSRASPGEINANSIRNIQKSEYRKHRTHQKGTHKR